MGIKLHFDMLSQPSRACYLLLKANKLKFDENRLSIVEGQHKKPEYIKVNPFGKVPCLEDGSFTLTESVAILKYICNSQKVAANWYPKDAKARARVDEFLSWHHTDLRSHCVKFFIYKFCSRVKIPGFPDIKFDQKECDELKGKVIQVLQNIEKCFLKDQKFVAGNDITIADLIAYNELLQLEAVEEIGLIKGNNKVNDWWKRVEAKLGDDLKDPKALIAGVQSDYIKNAPKKK